MTAAREPLDDFQHRAYVRSTLHRMANRLYIEQADERHQMSIIESNSRIRALRDAWDALVRPGDQTGGFIIGGQNLSQHGPRP